MAHPVRVLCALSLGGALLLASRPALACSCAFPELPAAREGAGAVFEGRVLAVSAPKNQEAGAERAVREVTLAVVRSWKGLDKHEQVLVRTAAEGSLCGFEFRKGKSYLIFADDEKDGLSVNACSRTRAIADAKDDLSALGAGATPVHIVAKAAAEPASRDAGSTTSAAADAGTATTTPPPAHGEASVDAGVLANAGASADAGVVADAGAPPPPPPKQKSGGCASTRGQASLAPYFLGIPALISWRRRRRARDLTRS